MHLAFIGFGEVGQRFSKDLLSRPGVRISAWDLKFKRPGSSNAQAAEALGVVVAPDAASAMREASCVISAVTADVTEQVARASAAHLRPGQFYFDVNSAAPTTKTRAAEAVAAVRAHYVEAAVMAPVAGPGIGVSILAGGPNAAALADRLNGLGMNITPVATAYGRASAMKLSRSIMIKGIEALIRDCDRAARHWGIEQEVYASLQQSFPGTDWAKLAATMQARVARHGLRRAAEMREAAEMVESIGIDPRLCLAVAEAQAAGADQA